MTLDVKTEKIGCSELRSRPGEHKPGPGQGINLSASRPWEEVVKRMVIKESAEEERQIIPLSASPENKKYASEGSMEVGMSARAAVRNTMDLERGLKNQKEEKESDISIVSEYQPAVINVK